MSAEYTEQETDMLKSLAEQRSIAKKLVRSGHPAKKAEGMSGLKQIAELTASIHNIAKRRGEEE